MLRTSLLFMMACGIATAAAAGEKMIAKTTFHVRIENVSTPTTLHSASGDTAPAPNSPGLWIVHTAKRVVFTAGKLDLSLWMAAIGVHLFWIIALRSQWQDARHAPAISEKSA